MLDVFVVPGSMWWCFPCHYIHCNMAKSAMADDDGDDDEKGGGDEVRDIALWHCYFGQN